jgi:sulfur transfer complex TusBCD TusB component (DsrH family)
MIEQEEKEKIQTIKEEMNLTEIPFSYPSKRLPNKLKEIVYEKTELSKRGDKIKRKITVRHPSTELGERVYLGLMAISKEKGFPQTVTDFSIYKIIDVLKMDKGGKSYNEIKRTLKELLEVCIYAEAAFWDNKTKEYMTTSEEGFHIIDRWKIKKKGDKEEGFFKWSDVIHKSIVENKYIKNLNFSYYLELKDVLARKLYRYLDKRIYKSVYFEIDIIELSSILGLVNCRYISSLKQRLDPALEELKKTGFLTGYEYTNNGNRIKFVKATKIKEPLLKNKPEKKYIGEISEKFKIKTEIIDGLIEEHGSEKIEKTYKYAKENADVNPGGLFLSALKEGYEIKEGLGLNNIKSLKIEAEKCYKGCFGHCAANYEESEKLKDKKSCYWCIKFADKKNK